MFNELHGTLKQLLTALDLKFLASALVMLSKRWAFAHPQTCKMSLYGYYYFWSTMQNSIALHAQKNILSTLCPYPDTAPLGLPAHYDMT